MGVCGSVHTTISLENSIARNGLVCKKKREDLSGFPVSIIKDVPVGVCQECGQRYYAAVTLDRLDTMVQSRDTAWKNICASHGDEPWIRWTYAREADNNALSTAMGSWIKWKRLAV